MHAVPTRLLAAAAVLCLTAACTGGSADGPGREGPAPAAPSPTGAASAASAAPTALPAAQGQVDDAAVDAALAWVLAQLDPAGPPPPDEGAYRERFAEAFTSAVTAPQLAAVLEGLRATGPYEVVREVSRSEVGELVVEAVGRDGTAIAINLVVTPAGQISGLLFTPGEPPELDTPVSSLDQAVAELQARGTLRFAAASVDGGSCTTAVGAAPGEQAPIASASKLYVLAAVVDAIRDDRLRWDNRLVITADVKSLPSGVLQTRPDLSPVTVQEAAELLISSSDNTAADLLLDAVGRDAVEAAQAAWGHGEPSRNTPWPTTGELFRLKAADPAVQQRWIDGDEAARRAVLAELADAPLPPASVLGSGPVHPEAIEWYASAEDLCRVMARLVEAAAEPGMEPLEGVLTANPGVPDQQGAWERIAFKGGSEPGVLSAVWLVEDAAGARRVLAASLVDPAAGFDEVQTILLLAAARDLLGEVPG